MDKTCWHCKHSSFKAAVEILGGRTVAMRCTKTTNLVDKYTTRPPRTKCVNGLFEQASDEKLRITEEFLKNEQ